MHWTRTTAAVLLAAAVAGCAGQTPGSALREGLRMIDLYRGGATAAGGDAAPVAEPADAPAAPRCRWWRFTWPCEPVEPAPAPAAEPLSYARTAADELRQLFPRLPNPDIYIHVPAHLATQARVPVPGYTTAVPLYDRVEYALPGESPRTAEDGEHGPAPAGEASP